MIKLNEEQEIALEGLTDFINSPEKHREEYATLSGKAGTGKTTILAHLVERFPNRRFIVSAISHKAKEVIHSKIRSRNVKAMTIAALLAMKMNDETGEFIEDPYETDMPIADADIVFIDEGSMIHANTIKYIFSKKMYRTIIIFAGDIGQIRPIKNNAKLNEVSPIFNTPNFFQLVTRVRQGEGNPILEHMDYYWDMTRNPKPHLDMNVMQKEDSVNEIGGIIYRNNMGQVIQDYLQYFKQGIEEKNTNIIKAVAYKNDNVKTINNMIRAALFGEERAEENQFIEGELLMMTDTYRTEISKVENSVEFAVSSIKPSTLDIGDYTFRYYNIKGIAARLSGDEFLVEVPVLAREDKDKFDRLTKKLFAEAKEQQGYARKQAFAAAWAVTRTFASVNYGYAITSHKS